MRVIVCGGRHFSNKPALDAILDKLHKEHNFTVIIEGDARGADRMAGHWARIRCIPCEVYYADWEGLGLRAGYERNQQMLDEGKPDLVIAFPGGVGTAMMVRIAAEAGVPVIPISKWTISSY